MTLVSYVSRALSGWADHWSVAKASHLQNGLSRASCAAPGADQSAAGGLQHASSVVLCVSTRSRSGHNVEVRVVNTQD